MKRYRNISGNSGVLAYEIGIDFIRIKFSDGGIYNCNYEKPGRKHVEKMKTCALNGKGLATYVNKFVREDYFSKL